MEERERVEDPLLRRLFPLVGVLLGETYKGRVDVTNSFAVPFEEDEKDKTIWFLDHSYLETMFRMFKRINGARGPRRG